MLARNTLADAIEVFLEIAAFDTKRLLEQLRSKLPPYMVPRNVRLKTPFPLNSNGKFDRGALLRMLEETETAAALPRVS